MCETTPGIIFLSSPSFLLRFVFCRIFVLLRDFKFKYKNIQLSNAFSFILRFEFNFVLSWVWIVAISVKFTVTIKLHIVTILFDKAYYTLKERMHIQILKIRVTLKGVRPPQMKKKKLYFSHLINKKN